MGISSEVSPAVTHGNMCPCCCCRCVLLLPPLLLLLACRCRAAGAAGEWELCLQIGGQGVRQHWAHRRLLMWGPLGICIVLKIPHPYSRALQASDQYRLVLGRPQGAVKHKKTLSSWPLFRV